MKQRTQLGKLLVEPPSVATGDIAFNLIVFFLVCASAVMNLGRRQELANSESKTEKKEQSENVEVSLTRTTAAINGTAVKLEEFAARLGAILKVKTKPEEKVVVLKESKDTPYHHFVRVTQLVQEAGGVITLELEEEQTVVAQ